MHGRNSPARQALHDAEARLAELQAEPLKPTGVTAAACRPVAGHFHPMQHCQLYMWLEGCSHACGDATGKALVTFAVPSGAMMCVAAAEPSLGRRAANVLLCRRAASSQLLKGEPVLVSRSVSCTCVTSCNMHRLGSCSGPGFASVVTQSFKPRGKQTAPGKNGLHYNVL